MSYASRPNSVSDAHYIVYHKGGRTQFRVNQQMGGGTWVYLGSFEFDEGENREGRVVLTNQSSSRGVVTADAVRFGGGVGQTERGNAGTSGLPRFLEGARYQAQWSGLPDSLYNKDCGQNDYNDDIRSRSFLLNYLGGGSVYMPGKRGKGCLLNWRWLFTVTLAYATIIPSMAHWVSAPPSTTKRTPRTHRGSRDKHPRISSV